MSAGDVNFAKLQAAYQGLAAGNLKLLYENLSEDIIWRSHSNGKLGIYRGIKSIETYFDNGLPEIEQTDVHFILENGNRFIALVNLRCHTILNGKDLEEHFIHVLRYEDGKIKQVDIYNKPAIN